MPKAKEVSFVCSAKDTRLISKIVDRAQGAARRNGDDIDRISLMMDITATHVNGNPLRLEALLDADDFNFAHDVWGICRHIDRETGKLTNFFSPRFSSRVEVAQS